MNNKFLFLDQYRTRYFSALIEFHQGSPLVTVWSQNLLHINITDFFYYVGNMHSIGNVGEIFIPPTITQSTFNGIPYFSITIQIPDVEARGFLRSITLIVAHDRIRPIISQDLIKIMNNFQQNALNLFLEEIPRFYLSIQFLYDHLSDDDMKKPTLNNMLHEIQPILQQFNLNTENSERNESISIEKIVTVNNELRDIKNLIKWEENLDELIKIISLLNHSSDIPSFEIDKGIEFGISSISMQNFFYYVTKNSINMANFDSKLCQNGVFGHLIFSLLSGYQVLIVSEDFEKAIEITEILVNFIPMFKESDIQIIDGDEINIHSSSKIIISKNNFDNIDNLKNLSLLDLDESFYQGLICSANSFVWQVAKINKNEKFRSFAAKSSYKLKTFADKFVRLGFVFMKNEFQNQHQFFSMLDSNDFHKDDLPIFNYWLTLIPAFKNIISLINSPCWSKNIGTLWI